MRWLGLFGVGVVVGGCANPAVKHELSYGPMGEASSELAVPSECQSSLAGVWSEGGDLWNWSYLLQSDVTADAVPDDQATVAEGAAGIVRRFEGNDSLDITVDRQAIAILSAVTIAASIRGSNIADTGSSASPGWSLSDGCQHMVSYAHCGLTDFTPSAKCALPGTPLPPPPAGDDPEDFCASVFGANDSRFKCTGSPLSNTLSFIASQAAGTSGSYWLTVRAREKRDAQMVWWPVFLAAMSRGAPSLVLFTHSEGQVGVLSVHEIAIQVSGEEPQVRRFEEWLDAQLHGLVDLDTGLTDTAAAPDLSEFTGIALLLPSSLKYRAYPSHRGEEFEVVPLQTWTPGGSLVFVDGQVVDPDFDDVVGIIDPCRDIGERGTELEAGTCQIRAVAWNDVADLVAALGEEATFEAESTP